MLTRLEHDRISHSDNATVRLREAQTVVGTDNATNNAAIWKIRPTVLHVGHRTFAIDDEAHLGWAQQRIRRPAPGPSTDGPSERGLRDSDCVPALARNTCGIGRSFGARCVGSLREEVDR